MGSQQYKRRVETDVDEEVVRACAVLRDDFEVNIEAIKNKYCDKECLTKDEVDQLVEETSDLLLKLERDLAVYGISCEGLFYNPDDM
jgi:SMC interacting uncharacterized protein involved in chromosome segregation